MKIYLAMWARGASGNDVTIQEMEDNKLYAKAVAHRIRQATESFHEVICPHEDPILCAIDEKWLDTKDPRLVPIAMSRCLAMLEDCDGLVAFDRGFVSEGMRHEMDEAQKEGMFLFQADDLTDETLEDLILALNEEDE